MKSIQVEIRASWEKLSGIRDLIPEGVEEETALGGLDAGGGGVEPQPTREQGRRVVEIRVKL